MISKGDMVFPKENITLENGSVLYKNNEYEVIHSNKESLILYCWISGNCTVSKSLVTNNNIKKKENRTSKINEILDGNF